MDRNKVVEWPSVRPVARRSSHAGLCDRSSGVTIIEVLIYTVLLALLAAPMVTVVLVTTRLMAENDAATDAEERNRAVLFRLSSEVRMSIRGTAQVEDGGRTLRFTPPLGFNANGVLPGEEVTYRILAAAGEAENGQDDNGNGLIDEARLSRTEAGEEVVICETLSLPQSAFGLIDGTSVRLKVTNLGKVPDAANLEVTREVTVNPRN